MAYRITYGPEKPGRKTGMKRPFLLLIAAAVLAVGFYAAGAWDALRGWLLPGDAAVTASALQTFTEQVSQGEDIGAAFACFCREIIENAQMD